MNTHVRIAIVAALATAVAVSATAQTTMTQATTRPAPIRSTLKTYTGTVIQVDQAARLVTTRGADGRTAVFEVPPALGPEQVSVARPGDVVTVTYFEGIGIRRKPAGEPPVDTTVNPTTGLRTVTATISAIDAAAGTVTFVGPRGRYTRGVADAADVATLQAVSVGERADVTFYEYVQSIRLVGTTGAAADAPAPPPPPAPLPGPAPATPVPVPDDFRHRLTVSFLWGLDNQFSGKVITAAAGSYNGVPITFYETTYDQVYGRMGLLKAGVGYRISPRSEVTANFVWSDSASEPVVVGTIGTLNAQVTAKFDNYQYWGIEAGQRFYFTRVRFTPFLGYYAGINRFTHINGDFYAIGNEGLINAQAAQFFDSSWAFSFGPTGGVLIGLGPFEVMGQVELRYMGGLSDVDPLSVAGLKDINVESSRWSVPFLFGARIRF